MNNYDSKRQFEEQVNEVKDDLKTVLEHKGEIKEKLKKEGLEEEEIQLIFDLLKDFWNGDYKEIPWDILLFLSSPIPYLIHALLLEGKVKMPLFEVLEKYKQFKRNQKELKEMQHKKGEEL